MLIDGGKLYNPSPAVVQFAEASFENCRLEGSEDRRP